MRDSGRISYFLRQTAIPVLIALGAVLFSRAASASSASTLFAFDVSPNGNTPSTELVADESGNLYGTTERGGDPRTGGGVAFRVAPGGALEVLHRFGTVPFDGLRPLGRLFFSGGKLYGTTSAGGAGARGTLFSLEPDGTGYEILHDFGARAGDGLDPRAGVTEFSGRLWGTTFAGGRRGSGTVFSFDPQTRGYAVVVDLDPSSSAGFHPDEPVAFADGRGFGIASEGGAAGRGAIFSFLPDGSGVAGVHAFDVSDSNGVLPDGPLTASGSVLYGVADGGGPKGVGIVYAIASDGGGFRIVHAFGGGPDDGAEPAGALLVADGVIYGTTAFGGAADWGVAYALEDGGGFSVLHSFPTDGADGLTPHSGLALVGGELAGTTLGGGERQLGSAFAIAIDGSAYRRICSFGEISPDGWYPVAGVVGIGDTLYGSTTAGGGAGAGGIFSMAEDGSSERILHTFDFPSGDGVFPGPLAVADGRLIGGTLQGGDHGFGTVFRIEPDGSGYVALHDFAGAPSDGWGATAIIASGGALYGISPGGAGGYGSVFSMRADGGEYRVLHSFSGGGYPVTLALSGDRLFGVTQSGGDFDKGVVFSLGTDGSGYRELHSFAGSASAGAADGDTPSDLILSGGRLFGVTRFGGAHGRGTIFSIETDGSRYALLLSFDASAGPRFGEAFGASLTGFGEWILVTAPDGGAVGNGVIFSFAPSTGELRLLYEFGSGPLYGGAPNPRLFPSGDGRFFGTTRGGGSGQGTVFVVAPGAIARDSVVAPASSAPSGGRR